MINEREEFEKAYKRLVTGFYGLQPTPWEMWQARAALSTPAHEPCGACGDGCKDRGSCRIEDESPGAAPVQQEPTELEMHRADYQAVQAAGFTCPGELLSAYKTLLKKQDHAEALAKVLEKVITLQREHYGNGTSTHLSLLGMKEEMQEAIAAYRASQKGGA